MALFEQFGAAKGKASANHEKPTSVSEDLSFLPENDFVELIWENGQIMMQGQSSRAKKTPPCPDNSYILPPHSPKKYKGLSSGPITSSAVKFQTMDTGLNEFYRGEMCSRSDDEVGPWFDYAIDESLQNNYFSSFLPELSGVTSNEPSQNLFDRTKKGSCSNHVFRDSNINSLHNGSSLDHGNSSKSFSGQTQLPTLRPRQLPEKRGTSTSNHCVSGAIQGTSSAVGFADEKLMKQNPEPSVNRSDFLNFTHFSRPTALYKSDVGNNFANVDSGRSSLDGAGFKHMMSFPDVKTAKLNSGLMGEMRSDGQFVAEKQVTDSRILQAKPTEESAGIGKECAEKDENRSNGSCEASTSIEPQKAKKPAVVSSVCSDNGVRSVSDDPTSNQKRKAQSDYDSEDPRQMIQDVEEESIGHRKSAHARGSVSKRCRAAEVHNLSERRRRDRINEKMRALQELIPNCNKVDKASMLDEAIDYLKTLQLQVQIMSMGAGLYMPPPMMLPPHMAQFSPMSVGMAAACSMLRGFPMQGSHFPSLIMPGHQALSGMAGPNFPIMGLPSQGLSLSMPHGSAFPGGPPLTSLVGSNANVVTGHVGNTDADFGSSLNGAAQNINGASSSAKQIPCQPKDCAVTETTALGDDAGPKDSC